MSIPTNRSAMISKGGTYLVHRIDKGLCVVPTEGSDRVTRILTREDRFDQGRELTGSESASDQTSAGWSETQSMVRIRSAAARRNRTALGCGSCGDVMRIDGRWAGTVSTQGRIFIEGRVEGAKYRAKYPPNLQLAPLELPFVVFNVWFPHPQLESPLNFAGHPEVAW